jgi:glycosyltransferase involved in cell wall biosynthesis
MPPPRILVNALSMSQGGGRSYVINLLRELRKDDRGFRFTLLASQEQLEGLDTAAVEVMSPRLPARPRALRLPLRVLYEELALPVRARRFDLLFCVADVCPPLSPVPVVVLMRNLNIYDRRFYDGARTRTLFRLARLGAPRARFAVFPSQAAADAIRASIPLRDECVAVVPYGVSPAAFAEGEAVASDVPYLFLPAAPERHKNIATLIESLRFVSDPSLELWIAGSSLLDPAHCRELEALAARLGLEARVRLLGPVPYAQLLAYYRGAAAFVFPSILESFGHPLLESMLAGAPVVASDIPAFREIAGDTALYFPPLDAKSLAACVDAVRADPAAAELRIARARERAEGFSWERSVDGLCRVFERALAPAPRGFSLPGSERSG